MTTKAARRGGGVAMAAVTALALAACGTAQAGPEDASRPGTAAAQAAAPAAVRAPGAPAAPAQPCADGRPAARTSYAPRGSVDQLSRGATVQAIKRRGRLIVGTSGDVLLWGARDPFSGRLQGFDISLAQEISRAIFGRPDRIEFRVINYAQRLPSLSGEVREGQQPASSRVDLVLHTMTINCDRWTQIAFSSEYYTAGQKVLVRSDNPALAGRKPADVQIDDVAAQQGARVCVAEGSTNIENLKEYPALFRDKVTVSDLGECLVKFQEGEADAITGDDTVLAGFAAQDPYAVVVGRAFSDEPYGIGVNRNQVDLVRFVNAVLDRVRADGTWARIYRVTMGSAFPGQPVPKPPAPSYGR